jgi:hypothetical protein
VPGAARAAANGRNGGSPGANGGSAKPDGEARPASSFGSFLKKLFGGRDEAR